MRSKEGFRQRIGENKRRTRNRLLRQGTLKGNMAIEQQDKLENARRTKGVEKWVD